MVRQLREAERLLDEGQSVADAAKHLEVSEQTYLRWRNLHGGMRVEDANVTSPRFFIPAAALDLGFIALLVAAIRQLVAAGRWLRPASI